MSLLIAWDGTANCYAASVLNTDTYYLFAPGYDPWFLAQYMTWDSRDVLVELFGRNAFFDTGLDGGAVFDSLYSACDTILLAEYWTWSAPGGSVLADVLVDAGEALLAGLGAFKAKLSVRPSIPPSQCQADIKVLTVISHLKPNLNHPSRS